MQNDNSLLIDGGKLHSTNSSSWQIGFRSLQTSLVGQIRLQLFKLLALTLLAVLVAVAVTVRIERAYVSTAMLILPLERSEFWASGDDPSSQSTDQKARLIAYEQLLLSNAIVTAKVSNPQEYSISLEPAYGSNSVMLIAGGPDASSTSIIAVAASNIAVTNARSAFLKTIISSHDQLGQTAATDYPNIAQSASSNAAATVQYLIKYLVHPWLLFALFAGWAVGVCAVIALAQPTSIRKFRFAEIPPTFTLNDSDDLTAIQSSLPVLASMKGDSSNAAGRKLEVYAPLISWLSGPVQHGLHARGRELLICRADDNADSSRHVTLLLAKEMCKFGKQVLLLDIDYSEPISDETGFQFPAVPGLSNILNHEALIEDCLLEDDEIPGLMAITAGNSHNDEAYDHLEPAKTTRLFKILSDFSVQVDVILIHCPSALQLEDYQEIARRADAAILIGDLSNDRLLVAAKIMQDIEANLIGLIEMPTISQIPSDTLHSTVSLSS